ncbi:hypothetical protein ACJX0J_027646, partial [Zea mays]
MYSRFQAQEFRQLDIVKTHLNKCEALFIKLDISKAKLTKFVVWAMGAYLAQFIGGYAKTFQSLENKKRAVQQIFIQNKFLTEILSFLETKRRTLAHHNEERNINYSNETTIIQTSVIFPTNLILLKTLSLHIHNIFLKIYNFKLVIFENFSIFPNESHFSYLE